MRSFRTLAFLVAGALAAPALAEPPRRVVSMNLCTDQLAMLLAAPGQLHSVSFVSLDPRSSAMVDEAARYVINHGRAEEIYLMQPDLVLAGRYSSRATVDMLQRLGVPVAIFDAANGLDAVRTSVREVGAALGRDATAAAMIADFDQRLTQLQADITTRPSAALYYANGYTLGDQTLAGQILTAAGFENAAAEAGFTFGGTLPLEILAMIDPEALITGQRYPGASRSEEILDHPVLDALPAGRGHASSDWVCGTPFVLRAIEALSNLRRDIGGP